MDWYIYHRWKHLQKTHEVISQCTCVIRVVRCSKFTYVWFELFWGRFFRRILNFSLVNSYSFFCSFSFFFENVITISNKTKLRVNLSFRVHFNYFNLFTGLDCKVLVNFAEAVIVSINYYHYGTSVKQWF